MSTSRFSQTALGAALLRVAHQLLDPAPHILHDSVTRRLLDPRAVQHLIDHPEPYLTPTSRLVRAHVLLRSLFAEARLHASLTRGVRQVVFLGAGLETFAYRQPDWARALTLFEVDHAGSQAFKRQRLEAAQVTLPGNLHFVSADLQESVWPDRLVAAGFQDDVPTFVWCLGVTMYLTRGSVERLLGWAARRAPGSELVVTYLRRGSFAPSDQIAAQRLEELGESLQTAFDADEFLSVLQAVGFDEVGLLTEAMVHEVYPGTGSEALPVPRHPDVAFAQRLTA